MEKETNVTNISKLTQHNFIELCHVIRDSNSLDMFYVNLSVATFIEDEKLDDVIRGLYNESNKMLIQILTTGYNQATFDNYSALCNAIQMSIDFESLIMNMLEIKSKLKDDDCIYNSINSFMNLIFKVYETLGFNLQMYKDMFKNNDSND